LKFFNLKKKAIVTLDPNLNINVGIPQLIKDLVTLGWQTPDIESYISQIKNLQLNMPLVADMGENLDEARESKDEILLNMGIPENQVKEIGMQLTQSKTKTFNLKKAQMNFVPEQSPVGDMGLNDNPELMEPEMPIEELSPILKFESGEDLKKWLDDPNRNPTAARTELLNFIEDPETQEIVARGIDNYYETNLKPNDQVLIAAKLFELLPSVLKQEMVDESEIPAHFTQACIKDTNEIIKKMAKNKISKKKIKKYNLQKTAQHKTMNNVIEYGPSNKPIIDPFYRMPVSDWHIVERNKGFGQDIGGIWNIDYETLWRTHIMDKYSRPYKDKEGNWVGGYIQKRFEVDKNIPEATNIQLKPGQRRKPRLPEYGLTEARLQDARAKGEIEGAIDTSKPFNWKEAQSAKKKISLAS